MNKSGGALAVPADRTREIMRHVGDELNKKQTFLSHMLPAEITPQRLRAFSLLALQRTPRLLECDVPSLLGAVYESAKAGLEPNAIDAVILPYKGKAQFQLMFRGAMKLARRGGDVAQIWSSTVRAFDRFVWTDGSAQSLIHEIQTSEKEFDGKIVKLPATEEQRGPLVAAYACARFADGFIQSRVVLEDEIARAKKTSKTADRPDSPWRSHEAAMWEKTAIKRLCKHLPMPDLVQRAITLDDQAEAGVDQKLAESWQAAPTDEGPEVTDYGRDAIDVGYENGLDPNAP
jgi:recombination protein RecT